ncbi:MAG: DUF1116 domain-containing protein [Phormidesmis sp.]
MPVLNSADQRAIDSLIKVEPIWVALGKARELIRLDDYTLLHAGPPFKHLDDISLPIYHSAILAILFEGWADNIKQAGNLIASGRIRLLPAQDRSVVTPLAAVVSPSMTLQVICDHQNPDTRAYSPLNGGNPPALRLGTLNLAIVEQLRWLHHSIAPALEKALHSPIALVPIADRALVSGNECHSKTDVGTQLLYEILQPTLSVPEPLTFIQTAPAFFLNLWMGACKCMLKAASGIKGSTLVTRMAGNGREFGISLSADPNRWITVPALPPKQRLEDAKFPEQYCGAIGDSAVVDVLGLGGMALAYAPQLMAELREIAPDNFAQLPLQLFATEHPGFVASRLRVGLTAAATLEFGMTPLVNLAILDRQGERGVVGKGIYRPPLHLFERAVSSAM